MALTGSYEHVNGSGVMGICVGIGAFESSDEFELTEVYPFWMALLND